MHRRRFCTSIAAGVALIATGPHCVLAQATPEPRVRDYRLYMIYMFALFPDTAEAVHARSFEQLDPAAGEFAQLPYIISGLAMQFPDSATAQGYLDYERDRIALLPAETGTQPDSRQISVADLRDATLAFWEGDDEGFVGITLIVRVGRDVLLLTLLGGAGTLLVAEEIVRSVLQRDSGGYRTVLPTLADMPSGYAVAYEGPVDLGNTFPVS